MFIQLYLQYYLLLRTFPTGIPVESGKEKFGNTVPGTVYRIQQTVRSEGNYCTHCTVCLIYVRIFVCKTVFY